VGFGAGVDGHGKSLPPTGIRSPGRPIRSKKDTKRNFVERCYEDVDWNYVTQERDGRQDLVNTTMTFQVP
jgi:hypothetical protein